jgi:hypothetical protein
MSEDRYNIKDLINVNQIGRIKFDISGIPQLTKLSLNNPSYNPKILDSLTNTEFFCPLYNRLYRKDEKLLTLTKQFINFKNSDVSSNDLLKKVTNQKIMSDFIKKTFFKQGKSLNFNDEQINEFKKNGNIKIEKELLLNNALIILNKIILKNKKAIIYYKKEKDARNRQYYLTSLPFDINNINIDDINNCPDYSKIEICKVESSSNRVTINEVVTKLYEKDKQKIKNKNNEQIKLFKEAFSSNETELSKKIKLLKDQENSNITKSVIIYDLVKKILNKPEPNKPEPNKFGLLANYKDISGNDKTHFENLIESERIRIVDNFKEYKSDKLFAEETFKKYIEDIVEKYFKEREKLKNDNYNSSITLQLKLDEENLKKIPKSIFSRDTWHEKYQDTYSYFDNNYKKTKKQLNDYKKECKELDKSGDYTIKQQKIIDNCKSLCGYSIPEYSIVDCSKNHLSCNICKTFVNCSFGTNIRNQCKTRKSKYPILKLKPDTKAYLMSNLFKIQRPPIKTLKYPTNIITFGNPPIPRGGKKKTKKAKNPKPYKRGKTIKRYKKYNKRKTYKR